MHKNVLITGAAGQSGSEFRYLSENKFLNCIELNSGNYIFTTREQLDIQSSKTVEKFFGENSIDVIVNCAAYTAVDLAEKEVVKANAVNHLAVRNLAAVAKGKSIKLIHISTDYVFNGINYKPYIESDDTSPTSVYGRSKLAGEQAMQAINPVNSIIIRTSWVYSEFGNNFVNTMLRLGQERSELGVVCDQIGSPTNARDLARVIIEIIPLLQQQLSDKVEVYHYSNLGVCSWYDFAVAIFSINKINCKVYPILSEAYPTPVQRPYYSVMDKSKINNTFGVHNLNWHDSLFLFLAGSSV